MGNQLLTDSVILKRTLMSLKSHLVLSKNVTTEYSEEFAQKGAKIGATVNIRKPVRYEVTEGPALRIQETKDQYVPLTVDKHYHVGMAFSEVDRTLSLDDFTNRYIEPATIALANKIDSQLYIDMYKQVFSSVGVPSATALPSTLKSFTFAKAKMALLGAPKGTYTAVVDPLVEATMVDGLKSLFQSSEQIKKQYEEGIMGYAAGCKFMMSQNVIKHTAGSVLGTPAIKTTIVSSGATSIDLDGIAGSITNCYREGDSIQIAGVYAVNPQTKQSTGELAQFVVTANTNSVANEIATLPISPAIISEGPYQNVSALPIDGALVTQFGAGATYSGVVAPQNLVFHKSAFALASVDLELPSDGVKATRAVDKDAGLSLTMTSQFDITNYRNITRIDFLGGWKCIYPELAARVVGQVA